LPKGSAYHKTLVELADEISGSDPVVKYGFCRGVEPVMYVSSILERFEHYKRFVVSRKNVEYRIKN
jgi:hypothetical protein